MKDQVLRAQLEQLIADIDAGRVAVPKPRRARAAVGGAVLAAGLSLGVVACGGSQGQGAQPSPPPTATVDDPGAIAEYMAPDPGPEPQPVQPGEPLPPPQALYGVPAPEPVPPPQAEYAAPAPDDPNQPPVDPGPMPEYAAPGPPPGPPRFAPPPPPMPGPAPMPGPVQMYAVEEAE